MADLIKKKNPIFWNPILERYVFKRDMRDDDLKQILETKTRQTKLRKL